MIENVVTFTLNYHCFICFDQIPVIGDDLSSNILHFIPLFSGQGWHSFDILPLKYPIKTRPIDSFHPLLQLFLNKLGKVSKNIQSLLIQSDPNKFPLLHIPLLKALKTNRDEFLMIFAYNINRQRMDCAMSMTDHILFIILQVILFKFEITITPNSSAFGEIECILVINACSATVFAPRILLGTFLC